MADEKSAREIARSNVKLEGERSAVLANQLMKFPENLVDKLKLDEDIFDALTEARRITSPNARRRAERALAGALRGHDLVELAQRIEQVKKTKS